LVEYGGNFICKRISNTLAQKYDRGYAGTKVFLDLETNEIFICFKMNTKGIPLHTDVIYW
jgi:hypothetical protein